MISPFSLALVATSLLAIPTAAVPAVVPPAKVAGADSSPPAIASTTASTAPIPTGEKSEPKRGVAYNDPSFLSAFVGDGSNSTWCYNWGSIYKQGFESKSVEVPKDLEYVPMLWGTSDSFTLDWEKNANSAIGAGAEHLLAFNEPDHVNQSHIKPKDAAAAYRKFMNPFEGRALLGAPAVTNGPAKEDMGISWLEKFLGECGDCAINFIPIHWYDAADEGAFDRFKEHVAKAYKAGGNLPIWVTEFGVEGSDDQQEKFLEKAIPWLDGKDYVERYAYFMAKEGSLISDNALSTLGKAFALGKAV